MARTSTAWAGVGGVVGSGAGVVVGNGWSIFVGVASITVGSVAVAAAVVGVGSVAGAWVATAPHPTRITDVNKKLIKSQYFTITPLYSPVSPDAGMGTASPL